jgi:hypothetical protein
MWGLGSNGTKSLLKPSLPLAICSGRAPLPLQFRPPYALLEGYCICCGLLCLFSALS